MAAVLQTPLFHAIENRKAVVYFIIVKYHIQPSHHALLVCCTDFVGHCILYGIVLIHRYATLSHGPTCPLYVLSIQTRLKMYVHTEKIQVTHGINQSKALHN